MGIDHKALKILVAFSKIAYVFWSNDLQVKLVQKQLGYLGASYCIFPHVRKYGNDILFAVFS